MGSNYFDLIDQTNNSEKNEQIPEIFNIAKTLGIKKSQRLTQENEQKINIFYTNEKMSIANIAKSIGKKYSTVGEYIRTHVASVEANKTAEQSTTDTIKIEEEQEIITTLKLIEEEQKILTALKLTASYKDLIFLPPSALSVRTSPYLKAIGISGEKSGAIATSKIPKGAVIEAYLGDLVTLKTLKNTFNVKSKKLNLHQFNYLMVGPEGQSKEAGDNEIVRSPTLSILEAAKASEISAVYFINHRSLMLITWPN